MSGSQSNPTTTVVRIADRGVSGPCGQRNAALRSARTTWVFLLDDDAVPTKGCLDALLAAAMADPGAAIVSPRVMRAEEPGLVHYDGARAHFLAELCLENVLVAASRAAPPARRPEAVATTALLVHRERAISCGLFDEGMVFFREDLEFSLRVRAHGWTIRHCPEALVLHGRPDGSRGALHRRRTFYQTRNRWGIILKLWETRTIALSLPLQAGYELMNLGLALRRGELGQYAAAFADLLRSLPEILAARARFQASRLLPDRLLLGAPPLGWRPEVLALPLAKPMKRVVDAASRLGWSLIAGRAQPIPWAVFRNYLSLRSPLLSRVLPRRPPPELSIEGTNVCNARCVFCAYPSMKRDHAVLPMVLFASAVDQYIAMGGDEVDLTPLVGDPLADPHLLQRLDGLAARPAIRRFHFYTNAILLTDEHVEKFLNYGERFGLYVSLGGLDRETYRRVMGVDGFDAVERALRALIEGKRRDGSRLELQVKLRAPEDNLQGQLWEYLREARREGLLAMDGIADYDTWGGRVDAQALKGAGLTARRPYARKGPCVRLLSSPGVLADGRVNACSSYRDMEATLVIGDLKTDSLQEIIRSPALVGLLKRQERGDFPETCRSCLLYAPLHPFGEMLQFKK